jgi:MFS family permease
MLSDYLGRKKMLVVSAILFFVSAVGTAFPGNFFQFMVFRVIGGLGIGVASMTSPMYIAEVSPARIRGRMVSINQFAIVSGMLIVYFVNYFIAGYGTANDRRTAQKYTSAVDGAVYVDKSFAADFLRQRLDRNEDREAASAYLAAQPGTRVKTTDVSGFLAGRGVVVDHSEVALTSQHEKLWNERYGWRWMFGSGVLPSLVFLALLLLVPESPRWLTKQGRESEALAVLGRVGGSQHAKAEIAEIRDALAHETGSLSQLFEPGMRVVLVIGITLAVLQQVTGINVVLYYAPEIFRKMGSGVDAAMLQTVLVGAVMLTFTVVAIWTVDLVGRKPLMLIGSTGMGLSLAAWGLAFYLERTGVWALAFVLGYIACFALSVGPVVWVILSEIFPTRIRGRAMAIATVCLWVANFVVTQTFTMMDEDARLIELFHHAFPFWLYAALCAATVIFVWRFVPETKGRTLEEIERSWGT